MCLFDRNCSFISACLRSLRLLCAEYICGLFKKYLTGFFSVETNEARAVCCVREVVGSFMRIRGFFSASRQRQSRAASV